jgi:hypothetical protein
VEEFAGRRFSHQSSPFWKRSYAAPCGTDTVYIKLIVMGLCGLMRGSAVRCGGAKITFRVRCIQPGSATYPLIRSVIYPGIPNSRRLATIGLPEPSTSTGHKTTVGITCLPAKVWRVQCRLRFDHRMRLMVRVPLIRWSLLVAERWKLLGRIQFQLFAGPATHAGAKSQRDAPRAGLRRRVPSLARLPTFAES